MMVNSYKDRFLCYGFCPCSCRMFLDDGSFHGISKIPAESRAKPATVVSGSASSSSLEALQRRDSTATPRLAR